MTNLTDNEKQLIPEIVNEAMKLNAESKRELIWMIRGMVIGGGNYDGRAEKKIL